MRRILPQLLLVSLSAQNPAPPPTDESIIRITVNRVEVDAVVTDRQGRAVKNLTKDDFEVRQDGKPQPITSVQWVDWGPAPPPASGTVAPKPGATPAPLVAGKPADRNQMRRTMAFVVDDLGLSFESIARLRDELKRYIRDRMQPTDLVAIVTTGRSIGAMSQFTSDKRLLLAAVDAIRWSPWGRQGVSAQQQIALTPEERMRRASPNPQAPGSPDADPEVIRQQMFMAGSLGTVRNLVLGLREYPGRKSVLLISESLPINFRSQRGDPTQDQTQTLGSSMTGILQSLADAANRNFVVIDTLDPRGLMVGGLQASDDVSEMSSQEVDQRVSNRNSDVFESQNGLSMLAQETGGTFQFNNNDIGDMVRRAVDGVGGYYLITYRPDDSTFTPKAADKWHRVQVRVKRADLRVRARRGFLGRPDQELTSGPPKPKTLAEAMMSPFAANDIRVRMTGFHVEDPKGGPLVTALLHIEAEDLDFQPDGKGMLKAEIDVLSVTFNAAGKIESQDARGFTLTAEPEKLESVKKNGIVYTVYHPAKRPGGFQMRIGLRERSSKRLGTASQFVEIPNVKKSGLVLSSLLVQDPAAGLRGGPAGRTFAPRSDLLWGARILNAKTKDGKHDLVRRLVVYRDGKPLFQSPDSPWKQPEIDDALRLPITGALKLGAEMKPGEYVLQLVVTDKLETNPKKRMASQAIDFDVIARQP